MTVRTLASPRLMAVFFVLMAAAALAVAYEVMAPTPAALAPLGLLVLNLAASVASNPRFRADLPLLVFHLALLAFVALLAAARLVYFEGTAKVPVGGHFTGELRSAEQGPLHRDAARGLRFANAGFTEVFPENLRNRLTLNRVRFAGADGGMVEATITGDRPLVLDGYRIYPTSNRGYAPVLRWEGDNGAIEMATLQLGQLAEDGFTPGIQWRIPGGPPVFVSLSTERADPAPGARRENLGAREARNKLVVRHDGRFLDLQAGDSVALPGGRLVFADLSAWMGYRIVYDPTGPWLIAAAVAGIGSLIAFYARRLWKTWDEE